jgi:hypothetical protein
MKDEVALNSGCKALIACFAVALVLLAGLTAKARSRIVSRHTNTQFYSKHGKALNLS